MPDSVTDDDLNRISTAAEFGALLRRLRDDKTQQNIADHARRHHLSLHRPSLSAYERGHELPTANELRAILNACGRSDLFDKVNELRLGLRAGPVIPPALNQSGAESSAPTNPSSNSDDQRVQRVRRPSRRQIIVAFAATVVLIPTAVLVIDQITSDPSPSSATPSSIPHTPPTHLDTRAAVEASRGVPLCAESLRPDPQAQITVLAQNPGPADAANPNRLVELHAAHDAQRGWMAWAHLAQSASDRDRLWLDWSYLPEPTEKNQWRQCGPHPVTAGRHSPAVLAIDAQGRQRWFRACGQAPPEDRPPKSTRNSFCTSWVPVQP